MRTTPPYRAEHVGSLLRPKRLLEARAEHDAGKISAEQLRNEEDAAIRDAIALQEEVGLESITDGELRRGSWHMDFLYEIGGIERTQGNLLSRFHNDQGDIEFTPSKPEVRGKLTLEHTIFGDAFEFLAANTKTGTPKLTIPSPSMAHYRGGRAAIDATVYPDLDEFWADLAGVYAKEIRRLVNIGCTYLQLDDTCFAYLNDPTERANFDARGESGDDQHLTYIRTFNEAVKDRPSEITIGTHMCRGNFRSSWVAQGGYDYVAEPLFTQLDVDAFFMEYDDERSGTFEPLRFVPKDKLVVLGLVTSKKPALETKDELKRRIEEASRYIDIDQLCLSPQCGFSSTYEGNSLTVEEERAKLALVVETAEEVWGGA
ncbi:MAG TPA: 5-methyltetrahydropteroyltriglutamate--homocysteine S-methyltransferase [Solirubrobacteraceae bacterium]|nr:5-methyltetrahydropteroyltriglutamate--homocysteine S-methyltransferase [Solirubrobacteraceae bacterium]